jgi:hypothetical protein
MGWKTSNHPVRLSCETKPDWRTAMPSAPIPHLYRSLHRHLLQRIPDTCDTRLTNLIFLMMGIFQSRSIQLNLIARKTPIRARKLSIVKRLARFLDNPAVRVWEWYHPFAEQLLGSAGAAGQVHLIIDASKVAFGFRLVMVALAEHVITHHLTDRRDLNLFRLGWDFLERRLALSDPIPPISIPIRQGHIQSLPAPYPPRTHGSQTGFQVPILRLAGIAHRTRSNCPIVKNQRMP